MMLIGTQIKSLIGLFLNGPVINPLSISSLINSHVMAGFSSTRLLLGGVRPGSRDTFKAQGEAMFKTTDTPAHGLSVRVVLQVVIECLPLNWWVWWPVDVSGCKHKERKFSCIMDFIYLKYVRYNWSENKLANRCFNLKPIERYFLNKRCKHENTWFLLSDLIKL